MCHWRGILQAHAHVATYGWWGIANPEQRGNKADNGSALNERGLQIPNHVVPDCKSGTARAFPLNLLVSG